MSVYGTARYRGVRLQVFSDRARSVNWETLSELRSKSRSDALPSITVTFFGFEFITHCAGESRTLLINKPGLLPN